MTIQPRKTHGQFQTKQRKTRIPFSLAAHSPSPGAIIGSIMSDTNIRVLIADDHPVVRSGLAMIIQYTTGIEVVAEASTGIEAVQLFGQHQPDVVNAT